MRKNVLREILNQGKPSFSTHIHATWPSIIEAIGHTGLYDYVEFVAEYGPYDLHDLDNMARAAELFNMGMMIKVDWEQNRFTTQRAIGSGFGSVLFADVRTRADAEFCVQSVKPDTPEDGGSYGVATRRHTYMGYGGGTEYVDALRQTVVVFMIEKKASIDNLEEILSVPGLDMIQWGGADFSMSIGKAGQRSLPEVQAAEKRVIETALRLGVQPRAEIGTPEQAKRYLDMGVKHFSIGTDIQILYSWLKENGQALQDIVRATA
ncbi:MAG: aldolase/citrate lyase family protein [Litorilinea sp.]